MAHGYPRILVLDSGVGGLSIVHSILQSAPDAQVTYLADDAYFPYGEKPAAALVERVTALVRQSLAVSPADMIVVACNTASTVALPALRAMVSIPVVGVVPAIKPAGLQSRRRRIGLLATPATVARPYIDELIRDFAADCTVTRVGSTELVSMAEDWVFSGRIDTTALRGLLQPLVAADVDVIVLGCTHFPLLSAQIRAELPPGISLLDSGRAIGRRVRQLHAPEGQQETPTLERDTVCFTGNRPLTERLTRFLVDIGMRQPTVVRRPVLSA